MCKNQRGKLNSCTKETLKLNKVNPAEKSRSMKRGCRQVKMNLYIPALFTCRCRCALYSQWLLCLPTLVASGVCNDMRVRQNASELGYKYHEQNTLLNNA